MRFLVSYLNEAFLISIDDKGNGHVIIDVDNHDSTDIQHRRDIINYKFVFKAHIYMIVGNELYRKV